MQKPLDFTVHAKRHILSSCTGNGLPFIGICCNYLREQLSHAEHNEVKVWFVFTVGGNEYMVGQSIGYNEDWIPVPLMPSQEQLWFVEDEVLYYTPIAPGTNLHNTLVEAKTCGATLKGTDYSVDLYYVPLDTRKEYVYLQDGYVMMDKETNEVLCIAKNDTVYFDTLKGNVVILDKKEDFDDLPEELIRGRTVELLAANRNLSINILGNI